MVLSIGNNITATVMIAKENISAAILIAGNNLVAIVIIYISSGLNRWDNIVIVVM